MTTTTMIFFFFADARCAPLADAACSRARQRCPERAHKLFVVRSLPRMTGGLGRAQTFPVSTSQSTVPGGTACHPVDWTNHCASCGGATCSITFPWPQLGRACLRFGGTIRVQDAQFAIRVVPLALSPLRLLGPPSTFQLCSLLLARQPQPPSRTAQSVLSPPESKAARPTCGPSISTCMRLPAYMVAGLGFPARAGPLHDCRVDMRYATTARQAAATRHGRLTIRRMRR